ncbi:hypothetical protein HJV72_18895 [Extibacter sp. GGCC_0201]|nr:hypothetical protein [Extibacter sp. GGCC_0201]
MEMLTRAEKQDRWKSYTCQITGLRQRSSAKAKANLCQAPVRVIRAYCCIWKGW